MVSWEASSPPAGSWSSERRGGGGGSVSGHSSVARDGLPPLQPLRELVRWGLLGRSGLPLPAPLPRLLLSVPRRTFNDVGN